MGLFMHSQAGAWERSKIYTIRGVHVMLDEDLGKKWFAVSKMDMDSFELIEKLK